MASGKKLFKISTVLLMFILMCVLRLWFGIIIFIGYGILQTLFTGKKKFCNGVCPLGNIQDFTHEKKTKRKKLTVHPFIKILFSVLFFGYIIYSTIIFKDNSAVLWQWMFRIMLLSLTIAYLMQSFFGKRTWCSTICPAGNLMSGLVKLRKEIPKSFK